MKPLPAWAILMAAVLWAAPGGAAAAEPVARPLAASLELNNIVHPVTAEYLEQGLKEAASRRAEVVLLRINTPGGLDTAMRSIISAILASPVPVIAWVGPSGSRAASAGFFILLAADVAAMAPGTNTGAAHPVFLGGEKMDPVMKQKVENDAAAYLRSIAVQRGRNASLAEKGVLESKSFSEGEALDNKLIDLVAATPEELLQKLDGRTIKRFHGEEKVLHLAGARLEPLEASVRQRFLARLIDPNLALVMLALGVLGLYVEFTHPGLILPGVAGAILLVLALFAFSLLPINWAGAVLIILAFVFFALEAKFLSHGVLAAGGILSMILGALILINAPVPEMRVRLATALSVSIPLGVITVFLLRLALKAWRVKVVTGGAGLLDEVGTAQTDLTPEGKIFVHGEIWNAVSSAPVERGRHVRVRAVEGLKLRVEPVEQKP